MPARPLQGCRFGRGSGSVDVQVRERFRFGRGSGSGEVQNPTGGFHAANGVLILTSTYLTKRLSEEARKKRDLVGVRAALPYILGGSGLTQLRPSPFRLLLAGFAFFLNLRRLSSAPTAFHGLLPSSATFCHLRPPLTGFRHLLLPPTAFYRLLPPSSATFCRLRSPTVGFCHLARLWAVTPELPPAEPPPRRHGTGVCPSGAALQPDLRAAAQWSPWRRQARRALPSLGSGGKNP